MKKKLLFLISALLLLTGSEAWSQAARTITGKIVDETGFGYPGASVSVKNSEAKTVSDFDGNFTINVPEGGNVLVISAASYADKEAPITSSPMRITLAPEARQLTGAVVTALAIKREKRELGYSATTLSNEELNEGNNVSALSAITGKTAGVNISSTTGGPGGSTRVVLRGEKSITGSNNALIVVDGVITNNGSREQGVSSLEQVDFGNRGNDVNPDDIESITVLKGPAAAALYGSAGANGAIMITTKSGKNNKGSKKTQMTFGSSFTISEVLKLPTLQNEYGQGNIYQGGFPDDRRENFSWGAPYDGQLRPWGQVINGQQKVKPYAAQKDNVRNFFKKGLTSENYLSLAGGSDKSTYFISLSTLNNTGIVPNTFYNKYSVRFNGSTDLGNNFYSNVNVNYLNIYSRVEASGQATGSVVDNLFGTPRDIPVQELKNLDNVFSSVGSTDSAGVQRYGYYGAYTDNPYFLAKNYDNRSRTDRILGSATIGYKKGILDIFNRIGVDMVADRFTQKTPKYNYIAYDDFWSDNPKTSNGGFSEVNSNQLLVNNDLIANLTIPLSEKLTFESLLGTNLQISNNTTLSGVIDPSSNGLVIPEYYNLGNNQGPVTTSNSTFRTRRVSAYGSMRLNYDRRLFLEMTGRNDFTSTLAPGNQSFFYPSITGSWVFTEGVDNDFTRKILNYGKLRAAYASVGNGANAYANNNSGYIPASINSGFGTTTFPFNGVPGFGLQNSVGNPDLRPERTNSYETGLELSFLKSRLTVEATIYSARTVDQIIAIPVAPSTGFTSRIVNVGEVENRGLELAVRATPIVTRSGFKWELFGTYYKNQNKVLSLTNGVSQIVVGGFSGLSIVAQVGKPYGAMYGIDLLRDSVSGRVIVDTGTGIPLRTSTTVYKGTYQPKFIASWGTTLRFKSLSLNLLFDTKQGGKYYNHNKRNLAFNGTSYESAAGGRDERVWPNSVYDATGNGDYVENTNYEFLPYDFYTNDAQTISGIQVIDASYVKLREASLTWNLPSRWFDKKYVGGASLGVFGNNLYIWTAKENRFGDPEQNSGGASNEQGFDFSSRPSLRNYGINLKVNF